MVNQTSKNTLDAKIEADASADGRTVTSSPGGSFDQATEPRDGFGNNPHMRETTENIPEEHRASADLSQGADSGLASEQTPLAGALAGFSGIAADLSSKLSSAVQSRLDGVDFRGLADRATEMSGNVGGYVKDFAADIPGKSRELGGKIDRHARANPWIHIAAVGVGALALGFLVGRSLAAREEQPTVTGLLNTEEDFVAGAV